MNSIEITGKSVEEATQAAAAKLGVDSSAITVTVIDQSKGLFGKSSVKIKAEVSANAVVETPAPAEAVAVESAPEPAPAEEEPKQAVAKESRKRPAKKEKPAEASEEEAAPATEESESHSEITATQEDADQILELVQRILAAGDLEINSKIGGLNGRYVMVEFDGKDVSHLIGKHGEVLNTLQYLVNIITARRINPGVRAQLDGNNYRKRREESLTRLATNIANAVLERGQEAVLDALPAFERRIVHKALSTIEGISTYSEGEEPNRRVVIAPAD